MNILCEQGFMVSTWSIWSTPLKSCAAGRGRPNQVEVVHPIKLANQVENIVLYNIS